MRSYSRLLTHRITWAFAGLGLAIAVVGGMGLRYLDGIRVYQLQLEGRWQEYQRMVAMDDVLKDISTDISAWQAGLLPVDTLKARSQDITRLLSAWARDEHEESKPAGSAGDEVRESLLLIPARQAFLGLTGTIASLEATPREAAVASLVRSLERLQAAGQPLRQFYFERIRDALAKARKVRSRAERDSVYFMVFVMLFIGGISVWSLRILRRQARQLMEQERQIALVTLVQHLAHEIRNPLSIVKSAASVIARRSEGDVEALAGDIASEVERVDGLLTDLLHLRRGGNQPKVPADMSALVLRVAGLFASKLEAAHVTLEVRNQASGILVPCHAEAIKQMVMNLLLNAIEASPGKGAIEITLTAAGGEYVLEVRDHGIGMDAGQRRRIFELMYTTKPYGAGIGLTVVKNIVEDHGGRIEVSAPPPSGTSFTVHLPMRP